MDCPKCNGVTYNELQNRSYKAGEVVDVSLCLDCGFEFYQVSEKYTIDTESPIEEMSQTIEEDAEHIEPIKKKTEYRLPYYSSMSVVYPS